MLNQWRLPALLLCVGFCSSADAAVLCANPSGGVTVRTTACAAGETLLDPVALGLTGPAGADGADGADGVSGYEAVHGEVVSVEPGQTTPSIARCPADKMPVGGGYTTSGSRNFVVITDRRFDSGSFGWVVFLANTDPSLTIRLQASAVCVTVVDETA